MKLLMFNSEYVSSHNVQSFCIYEDEELDEIMTVLEKNQFISLSGHTFYFSLNDFLEFNSVKELYDSLKVVHLNNSEIKEIFGYDYGNFNLRLAIEDILKIIKNNHTQIVILLDTSEKLICVKDNIKNGLKEFIKEQKQIDKECIFSLVTSKINIHQENIQKINITDFEYNQSSLLDSVVKTILQFDKDIKNFNKKPKVLFVIISSGQNNLRLYTLNYLKQLIKNKEKHNWEFVYFGSNQDPVWNASKLGINTKNAYHFTIDSKGIKTMIQLLNKLTSYSRLN